MEQHFPRECHCPTGENYIDSKSNNIHLDYNWWKVLMCCIREASDVSIPNVLNGKNICFLARNIFLLLGWVCYKKHNTLYQINVICKTCVLSSWVGDSWRCSTQTSWLHSLESENLHRSNWWNAFHTILLMGKFTINMTVKARREGSQKDISQNKEVFMNHLCPKVF